MQILRSTPAEKRSGAILVLVTLLLPVLLFMVAFNVDIAYMQLVNTELQSSLDAAVKAGVEALAREQDETKAKAAAIRVAKKNLVAGRELTLTEDDIKLGRVVQNAEGGWDFQEGQTPYNALRVTASLTEGSPNGSVPFLFAGIVGYDSFEPTQEATAGFQENDVALVVDRSHSMCFDLTGIKWSYPPATPLWPDPVVYAPDNSLSRWASLTTAVDLFLTEVEDSNSSSQVSLVTFGSWIDENDPVEWSLTGRIFEPVTLETTLAGSFAPIRNRLNALGNDVMQGATDISSGLQEGINELKSARSRPLATKFIILFTDGAWNEGLPPRDLALQAASEGITIHTVTLLADANQADMIEVADLTGGRHYHADSEAELTTIFREIARSLPVVLVD